MSLLGMDTLRPTTIPTHVPELQEIMQPPAKLAWWETSNFCSATSWRPWLGSLFDSASIGTQLTALRQHLPALAQSAQQKAKARSAFALLAETLAAERKPGKLVEYRAPLWEEKSEREQTAGKDGKRSWLRNG